MNLRTTDRHFAAKGATHYHDSRYPAIRVWCPTRGTRTEPGTIFSRHYFNPEGTEIGYAIPDMLDCGTGVHEFETPRVWGIPHEKIPLAV